MSAAIMEEDQLALLVQTLKSQIGITSEKITQLQTVSNTLLKPEDTEAVTDTKTEPSNKSLTRELEKRRLQLIMDVQKHDYVGEKLMVLINQSEELLAYLKLFLVEPRVASSEENSNYISSKVNATAECLKSHIQKTQADQTRIAMKLSELNDKMTYLLDTTITGFNNKATTGTKE